MYLRHLTAAIALLLTLFVLTTQAQSQTEFAYEEPAPLDASRLLPGAMLRSAQHQITGVTPVAGNRVVFDIDSEIAGIQHVESISLVLVRIRELLTLAQARRQYVQDNPSEPDENRGKIRVKGKSFVGILADPFSTSAKVVSQLGSNVGQTLNELGTFPGTDDQHRTTISAEQNADPVFASHRRNIASQLGLDIYTSNLQVQAFLDNMARARINGQPSAGITTVSLNQKNEVNIDGGRVDNRIRTSLLNQDRSELFMRNEGLLQQAGIEDDLIKKFLTSPVGTPSHKTSLTEYLAYLQGVGHREALIKAALTANNEVDALATVAMLRMFAYYHENFSPLKTFISAGHLTLALSQEGTLLIALPFDTLYWDRETETVFDALNQFSQDKGILQRTVLLLGAATNTAREALEQRGFHILERYLYAR